MTQTYLGGESYAGQYIPYFAESILDNKHNLQIPLKGIAIGNGWIDSRAHYASYITYLVKMGILPEGSEEWKEAKQRTDDCMEAFDKHEGFEPINLMECEGILLDVANIRQRE